MEGRNDESDVTQAMWRRGDYHLNEKAVNRSKHDTCKKSRQVNEKYWTSLDCECTNTLRVPHSNRWGDADDYRDEIAKQCMHHVV